MALLDVNGSSIAAWFHVARVTGGAPENARAEDTGDWRLEWVSVEVAALELAQLEERRLVRRAVLDASPAARIAAGSRAAWIRLVGREALVPALFASLALMLCAAWSGWLAEAPDEPAALASLLPRLVLAALAGGWLSSALRLRGGDDDGRSVVVGALAGGILGTLVAALLAAGLLSAVSLGPRGALLVAWLAGFLERFATRDR